MKTLDEVITELEDEGLFPDALHYLRTYRENQQTYEENSRKAEEARERYLEAVRNCEQAENKYKRLYEGTSQNFGNTSQITCPKCHSEFVILPEANNALDWSELKQMEGKPVWVEYDDHFPGRKRTKFKEWEVISYVSDDRFITKGDWDYHKSEMGDVWNAYRKELK